MTEHGVLGLVCYDSDTDENEPAELDQSQLQANRAMMWANTAPRESPLSD